MRPCTLLVLFLTVLSPPAAGQLDAPPAGSSWWEGFSQGLGAWTSQRLHRRATQFEVVTDHGNLVLRAFADRSAAALWRDVPAAGPGQVLTWRWKIASSLAYNRNERTRRGDDYSARVFAVFGDEIFTSDTRALLYVWSGNEPVGSTYRSPYAPGVATIVLQQGDQRADEWITERRRVLDDYRAAFGEAPPPLRAVAIMVDTDNTETQAVAWFDDFSLRRATADTTQWIGARPGVRGGNVLEGQATITIDDKPLTVGAGEAVLMPANVPHALDAPQAFKMLLILVTDD